MKVKNLRGTADKKCNCGSWLEHWENYTQLQRFICSVKGCSNIAGVGAHVIKVDSNDNNSYIVPMCYGHNNKNGAVYELKDGTNLVSANVQNTCAK